MGFLLGEESYKQFYMNARMFAHNWQLMPWQSNQKVTSEWVTQGVSATFY